MSLMFLAAMMMAQAPADAQPAPAQAPMTKKQKPKQVCEMIEVTGSRSKRRVCRDADGNLDLGPGVHSGSIGGAKIGDQSAPGSGN
jgi:hypothetical protein